MKNTWLRQLAPYLQTPLLF